MAATNFARLAECKAASRHSARQYWPRPADTPAQLQYLSLPRRRGDTGRRGFTFGYPDVLQKAASDYWLGRSRLRQLQFCLRSTTGYRPPGQYILMQILAELCARHLRRSHWEVQKPNPVLRQFADCSVRLALPLKSRDNQCQRGEHKRLIQRFNLSPSTVIA